AFLYVMALLGTWTALIPGKVLETRRLDWASRRLTAGVIGYGTGLAGLYLARLLQIDLAPQTGYLNAPLHLMPLYFPALFGAMAGWWGVTPRDRPSRFRIRTLFWTGLLSAALFSFWPFQRNDGIAIATMIATTVQLVSPWNRAAATYARYVNNTKKKSKSQQRVA